MTRGERVGHKTENLEWLHLWIHLCLWDCTSIWKLSKDFSFNSWWSLWMAKVFLTIANGGFSYYNLVNNSTHFWILLAPKITHQLLKIHKTVIKRKEKTNSWLCIVYISYSWHTNSNSWLVSVFNYCNYM